ncbi:MAG TPA: hypothetical protein VN132_14485 [Bdellovibrio sp.]|nr:hypothetical protein [Bdellovibrio sp.]
MKKLIALAITLAATQSFARLVDKKNIIGELNASSNYFTEGASCIIKFRENTEAKTLEVYIKDENGKSATIKTPVLNGQFVTLISSTQEADGSYVQKYGFASGASIEFVHADDAYFHVNVTTSQQSISCEADF